MKNLTSVQGKTVTLYARWKKLPEKRIWIGDSRGVGIQRSVNYDPGTDTFICLGAQSYWPWFQNTALPQAKSILAGLDMERYSVELILMMSINDCANYAHGWIDYTAQNYIADLKALQKKKIRTADGTHYSNADSARIWQHMVDCIEIFRDGGTP